jgi:hypothetical protein
LPLNVWGPSGLIKEAKDPREELYPTISFPAWSPTTLLIVALAPKTFQPREGPGSPQTR